MDILITGAVTGKAMGIPKENIGILIEMSRDSLFSLTKEELKENKEYLKSERGTEHQRDKVQEAIDTHEFNVKYPKKFTRINLKDEYNGIKHADCKESVADIIKLMNK